MPEFVATALQSVTVGQNVVFTETPVPCNKAFVLHRDGSGIFTLRGPGCGCGQCFSRYKVSFGGNIAIPDGGDTATPVALAISLDGEALAAATMIETPGATAQFNNVFAAAIVTVPKGCCATVGVVNSGTQAAYLQNASLTIERVA